MFKQQIFITLLPLKRSKKRSHNNNLTSPLRRHQTARLSVSDVNEILFLILRCSDFLQMIIFEQQLVNTST